MLFTPIWAQALQPASFRGIEFQVRESEITRGRRIALHEYAFRDTPWAEDLGRSRQEINFQGWLVGDDVYAQRDALAEVCDIPGVGTLVHPSLGSQQAVLLTSSFGEKADDGRMVAIELHFIISDPIQFPLLYPLVGQNALAANPQAALNLIGAAISDFVADVAAALALINVVNLVAGTIAEFAGVVAGTVAIFADLVFAAANIALAPISAVRGISIGQPNITLGRYAQGNIAFTVNAPGVIPLSVAATLANAVTNALATACVSRAAVASAIAGNAVLAQAGDPSFGQSVADLVEAARTTINDPSDQIQSLVPLCSFTPADSLPAMSPISQGTEAVTIATGALCRRAALSSMANACAAYQARSSTEVQNIINQVSPLFDAEITSSADNGDLPSYQNLRDLKTTVIGNLQAFAANLPPLMTVTTQRNLPSLVWSYRLYANANRSDELIQRVDPPNPNFMPLSFLALSS